MIERAILSASTQCTEVASYWQISITCVCSRNLRVVESFGNWVRSAILGLTDCVSGALGTALQLLSNCVSLSVVAL